MMLRNRRRLGVDTSATGFIRSVFFFVIAALSFSGCSGEKTAGVQVDENSLARTKHEKKLRVGYGGFPPYTILDPNQQDPSARVSGFCVDIINEIAKRQTPPWKVEWHKANWETLRADMYSGRFDVLADGVYLTVGRASEFLFTEPFSYFGVAVAVVRKDEKRFSKFEDLDREGIIISLAEGWTSTDFARKMFRHAKLHVIPVGDDPNVNFMDVIEGRADAVLQDVPTVIQFVRAHPKKVRALWLDDPPVRVAASFVLRQGDIGMYNFLNSCIKALQIDGTIEQLDTQWLGFGEYRTFQYRPGRGLLKTNSGSVK